MNPENQVLFYLAIALAAFLTGLTKGGLGGMIGGLITPMMVLFMPMDLAIGLLLPILVLGDVFAIIAHWRRWHSRMVWPMLGGGLVGVTIATFFLTNVPVDLLRRVLGVIVMIFVLYRIFEHYIMRNLQYERHGWHGPLAGGVAGLTSTLAHIGGPPITIYLMLQDLSPPVFVATSALFFACLNWVKVAYYYFAGLFRFDLLVHLVWFAPLVPLGVWIGKRVVYKVNKVWFDRLILVFLVISGAVLLFR